MLFRNVPHTHGGLLTGSSSSFQSLWHLFIFYNTAAEICSRVDTRNRATITGWYSAAPERRADECVWRCFRGARCVSFLTRRLELNQCVSDRLRRYDTSDPAPRPGAASTDLQLSERNRENPQRMFGPVRNLDKVWGVRTLFEKSFINFIEEGKRLKVTVCIKRSFPLLSNKYKW